MCNSECRSRGRRICGAGVLFLNACWWRETPRSAVIDPVDDVAVAIDVVAHLVGHGTVVRVVFAVEGAAVDVGDVVHAVGREGHAGGAVAVAQDGAVQAAVGGLLGVVAVMAVLAEIQLNHVIWRINSAGVKLLV